MTAADPSAREATRLRIVQATLACVERWGITKTSLEDVAAAADLSRATVYRYFPGGRDEVISETVRYEVEAFMHRIEDAIEEDRSLGAKLVHALMVGHRAIEEHGLLQQVLSTEREVMLAELAQLGPLMVDVIASDFAAVLADEQLVPGLDPAQATEYVTKLYLSYLGAPGRVDLDDPVAVERLVRTQFLAGVLAVPAAPGPTAPA